MSVKRVYEVIFLVKNSYRILRESRQQQKMFNIPTTTQIENEYQVIHSLIICSVASVVLFMSSVIYAGFKFWAVFYCPASLWNLALTPYGGCVDLNAINPIVQ